MTVPPVPDHKRIPSLSNFIQDLLRNPPPVMRLDMGLGSREQSQPAHDPAPAPVIASIASIASIAGDPAETGAPTA
jgi:hypothetical protein